VYLIKDVPHQSGENHGVIIFTHWNDFEILVAYFWNESKTFAMTSRRVPSLPFGAGAALPDPLL